LRDKPAGTVRITLSDHALQTTVWPKLRPVLRDYPDLRVELYTDNGMRNIVEERFDAGVRLGESNRQGHDPVRIGPDWRLVAVASRTIRASPGPENAQDLVGHSCINMRQTAAGGLYAWEFEKKRRELRVRVGRPDHLQLVRPMIDAAISGYGMPTSRKTS